MREVCNIHILLLPNMKVCRLLCISSVLFSFASTSSAAVDIALKLDSSIGNNSNLLRIPGSSDVPDTSLESGGTGTSLRQLSLDAALGVPLGSDDTRLILTTQLRSERYGQFSELNHTAEDLSVQLPWRFGDLWEGNLIHSRLRRPYSFDTDYRQLDLTTQEVTAGVLVLKTSPSISFPVFVSAQTLRHEDKVAHGQLDEDRKRLGAAFKYTTPDGNSVQIGQERSRSKFVNQASDVASLSGDRYRDINTYADFLWIYSVKTRVAGRIAFRQREYNVANEIDKTLTETRLTITHVLSPKTRLDLQLYRQPLDSTAVGTLYTVAKGVNLRAAWTYSPQTTVIVQAQRENKNDVLSLTNPGGLGDDIRAVNLGLRVQHVLTRGVSVYASADHERLERSRRGQASQTVFRVGVDYSFENISGAQARTRAATLP